MYISERYDILKSHNHYAIFIAKISQLFFDFLSFIFGLTVQHSGSLVPWAEIEAVPLQWTRGIPNHWSREFPFPFSQINWFYNSLTGDNYSWISSAI